MEMKTLCIYHDDCMDGAAAAAVVSQRFKGATLFPATHGQPAPQNVDGRRVVIVDFSYPAEVLESYKNQAKEFLWFDHHKTALPILQKVNAGVIDLSESGATLTWKQLFPGKKLPKVLEYVRDKDLWLWKLPKSREISAALREMEGILNPLDRVWNRLLKGLKPAEWKDLVQTGEHSRRLLRERIEKAASRGFAVDLDGVKAFAVNWSEDASDLGEYVYKELGHEAALIFSYNGREWSFSLRSAALDVSEIAVRRGGGGHKGAAGFRSPDIDWLFKNRIS